MCHHSGLVVKRRWPGQARIEELTMVAVREPAAAGIGISLCNRVLRQPPMKLAPAKVAIAAAISHLFDSLISKVQLNLPQFGRNVSWRRAVIRVRSNCQSLSSGSGSGWWRVPYQTKPYQTVPNKTKLYKIIPNYSRPYCCTVPNYTKANQTILYHLKQVWACHGMCRQLCFAPHSLGN